LIRVNDQLASMNKLGESSSWSLNMPFDGILVSLVVVLIFVAFALVIAWADQQTRPDRLKPQAPAVKRRSF